MPIYEYLCQSCNHQFEKLQKISDEPLVDCPECAKSSLKKMVSASAFRLKGGGWYETDFKSDNQRNLAGEKEIKKSDDKSDTKASADKKSDGKKADNKESTTKPDKKAEKKTSKSKQSPA